jgi:circadian clock protein KaiC
MDDASIPRVPRLRRFPTGVPGFDLVLGGGLFAGDAYLVVGDPGTGKTTLGNQIAFAHAAEGHQVLYVTLQTETHDRMLAHLADFKFVRADLIGPRVRYVSLLGRLRTDGLDGMLDALQQAAMDQGADLLVVDGAGTTEAFAESGFVFADFVHRLQSRLALIGCTTMLLANQEVEGTVAPHVDGVIEVGLERSGARDLRWLRVPKLRGSAALMGPHRFIINDFGLRVYPRLESLMNELEPPWYEPQTRLGFGNSGLDAMLSGGLPLASSTMILGTPGAGKTMLGLQFLAEGARRGEPGLMASFHETVAGIAATGDLAGLNFSSHLAAGLIKVFWRPPLELSPDAWAWELLAVVDQFHPRRLVVDTFSDLAQLFVAPDRQPRFATALTNDLRLRGVTSLVTVEVEAVVAHALVPPSPAISASMDNGIWLRTVDARSSLRRLISVLKLRQSGYDPAVREFSIGPLGIEVGEPFDLETNVNELAGSHP